MSNWILSIVGVCFISILVDLLLPKGKLNGHVRMAVNYVIIFVVVFPLPKLVNSQISIESLFPITDISIQQDYIYNLNQYKLNTACTQIQKALNDRGIIGSEVTLSADVFSLNMEIDAVYVDLYNVVISEKLQNINIKTEVVSVVLNILDISKDKVFIYE